MPLLGFRLAGQAKRSFASAVSTQSARGRYAMMTYGDGVNWLLQKYTTPDLLNKAYTEVITAHQEPEEAPRAFGDRIERLCDRLDELFKSDDVVDSFVNGLNDAVKAHVLTFQMTNRRAVSFPEVVTAAQIYWEGVQKIKVDVRRHVRNTTTPIRVATVAADGPAVAAATMAMPPPRFARVEREDPRPPRSPSPRRDPRPTDVCFNCDGLGHFSRECPEPRRGDRGRPRSPRVNVLAEDGARDDQAQEN